MQNARLEFQMQRKIQSVFSYFEENKFPCELDRKNDFLIDFPLIKESHKWLKSVHENESLLILSPQSQSVSLLSGTVQTGK